MKCVFQLLIVCTFFKAVYTSSRIYKNSCFRRCLPVRWALAGGSAHKGTH